MQHQGSEFMGTALVPAVLVSACALLLLSFNNRIVAVLTRQRALHRELLQDAQKCRKSLANTPSWQSLNIPSAPSSQSAAATSLAATAKCKEDLLAAEERFASAEWSTAITQQIEDLRREAALIRAAVACLLTAILLFLASGVMLAMSTLWPRAETPAVVIFLLALLSFSSAILLMLSESFLIIHPVVTERDTLKRIISAHSQLSLQVLAN